MPGTPSRADLAEREVLEAMERQERPIGQRQAVERPLQQVEVGGPVADGQSGGSDDEDVDREIEPID